MSQVRRVEGVALTWGESVTWDDVAGRLYFVDCATQTLHWLDGGEPPLQSMTLPSLPTGLVLTDGDAVVVCLGDGLNLVDVDAGTVELLAAYPDEILGRANDVAADGHGNLITGTLNMAPGPGSLWQYSAAAGWRHLADDAGNVNGPVVTPGDGGDTLTVSDTTTGLVNRFSYDAAAATVCERSVAADHAAHDGVPDGATADADGVVWSCVLGPGLVVAVGSDAPPVALVALPASYPSDVTFGGPALDTMFVTTIALDIGGRGDVGEQAGALFAVDGVSTGRPEPRLHLGG